MHPALAVAALLTLSAAAPRPPRLTLFITVDSLSADVLMRNRGHYHAGLAYLLNQGAFFPNARYEQAENVTAAGHTTLATGAYPWRHGIVGNRVYNRSTGKLESIFADANHPVLEAPLSGEDVSPERLMAETLSDRLRVSTQGRGKAVAIAGKARAAIAQAGRLGQAWWFNDQVGKFVTGTFYAKEFPGWVKAFNDRKLADAEFAEPWRLSLPSSQYVGEDDRPFEATSFGMGRTFPHPTTAGLSAPGPQSRQAFEITPGMNDLLVKFAQAALAGEGLGRDEHPDLLYVSFSSIDLIYHHYGPYSWEMQDALVRLDRSIGELITAAERAAGGRSNLLVVLSADHGGAAIPEEWAAAGLPANRIKPDTIKQGLSKELQTRFGASLVLGTDEIDLYLNTRTLADRKLDGPTVRRAAAQWLAAQPYVALAVAKDDLATVGELAGYAHGLRLSYYPERSGDVLFLLKPFNVLTDEDTGTAHAMPYSYDTQIPIVLVGRGVRGGTYRQEIHPVDIVPTLASLLLMGAPAQSEGVPLAEILGTSVR